MPQPGSNQVELRMVPTLDGAHSPPGPVPSSLSGSEPEDEGRALLHSSAPGYLSDDGTTPLVGKDRLSRRQQLLHWSRMALRFLLAQWLKFLILGIIITLIVLVSVKGFSIFGVILRWFQARNNWAGWGIFIGMYCAVVALFLPGIAFIMGAGFVFGFWWGLLAVWAGGAVGQALAFLLARYLLKAWVESAVRSKWKKWEYVDKAIELDGWKLLLIMRFSPIIPYNLLNIAMATTSMSFWTFTIVSAVGIIWECAVFCYLGSMAENVTAIASDAGASGVWEWILLGVSLVMCVAAAVLVSFSLKKAMRRAEVHMSSPSLAAVAAAAMSEEGESQHGGAVYGHGYPAALEREGFLGAAGANAYARLRGREDKASPAEKERPSPQFELKPVGSGGEPAGAALRKLKVSGDPGDHSPSRPPKRGDLELGHGAAHAHASATPPMPRRRLSGSISAEDF